VLTDVAVDRIRTQARQFNLTRALIGLLLFPIVALAWLVSRGWRILELVVGYLLEAWKEGWHSARGDR
jgi:hypothetical protein